MIRIELTDDDLGRTRLALSPLWELFASLFWLHDERAARGVRARGSRRTRSALRGVELGPLDLSIPLRHTIPDFAAPIPKDPLPHASPTRSRGSAPPTPPSCARTSPRAGATTRRRRGTRSSRVRARWSIGSPMRCTTYWEAALADDWPQLRAVLEGEMLGRARALALSGPEAVLEDLHPSVRWRDPIIELIKEKEYDMHLEGRPLVLIPLVFARGVLMGESEDERAVAIGYQARGTAALWTAERGRLRRAPRAAARPRPRRRSCARSTGRRRRPSSPGD